MFAAPVRRRRLAGLRQTRRTVSGVGVWLIGGCCERLGVIGRTPERLTLSLSIVQFVLPPGNGPLIVERRFMIT